MFVCHAGCTIKVRHHVAIWGARISSACWEYEIFIDSTRSLLNDNQQEVCHAVGLTISPGILCFGCSAEVTHGHSCCVVQDH